MQTKTNSKPESKPKQKTHQPPHNKTPKQTTTYNQNRLPPEKNAQKNQTPEIAQIL